MPRLLCVLLLAAAAAAADDPPFQLKPGEFPPPDSWHPVSGELIALDHVNRTGMIRPDRDDTQRRGDWDIARPFALLPFGVVYYHGAPAELRDVPIGTHLHGRFYADPPKFAGTGKNAKPLPPTYTRVLRLEDDFSRDARLGRLWRIDAADPATGTLAVTGVGPEGKSDLKPTLFKITPATRVWKGRGFGTLDDLAAGRSVLLNLTVCTLKGPGRVTDVWLDADSRAAATARQLEVHRLYQKEHGLAGRVTAVDNAAGVVEVTLFDLFDLELLEPFTAGETAALAVAGESLRTYDQINDVKRGPIVGVDRGPAGPGSSGVKVRVKPSNLLEGYRPGRVVRVFPSAWKVDDLPREERLYR